ncbi:hypothetical protein Taro_048783 [Colocasia esculenta]|uniref:DUF8040 domain-containing protein n=1 Tax=Colocasia esculenta TaxID=4460 RepID=A0A843X935_COLES|nr:hypothetical protein [Colocasia esculenta]
MPYTLKEREKELEPKKKCASNHLKSSSFKLLSSLHSLYAAIMRPSMFLKLRDILVEREPIRDSRYVTTSEQLAMFLYAMGHGVATGAMYEHFQHSSKTISYYVNCVIKAITLLRFTYIVLPSGTDPVHPRILHDDRFYPYFKWAPKTI